MRALILILAAAVVALAISIVHFVDGRSASLHRVGEPFHIGGLIANARGGESAWYREQTSGRVAEYRVVQSPEAPLFSVPFKQIRRRLFDAKGHAYEGPSGATTYAHSLTEHGFLPLTAPEVPDALDRVWILRSIRPDQLTLHKSATSAGETYACWRVDLIDPALPEGQDTVVAWVTTEVPVYGLLKWKRGGETWAFTRGSFAAERGRR